MGIKWEDAPTAGSLLGVKLVLTEFTAFIRLADPSLHEISERTRLIMTYALCGFANVASVGINLAGFSVLAPDRRAEIIGMVWKAMFAGFMATCLTGAVIGAMPAAPSPSVSRRPPRRVRPPRRPAAAPVAEAPPPPAQAPAVNRKGRGSRRGLSHRSVGSKAYFAASGFAASAELAASAAALLALAAALLAASAWPAAMFAESAAPAAAVLAVLAASAAAALALAAAALASAAALSAAVSEAGLAQRVALTHYM